ncbi:VOC family protein [Streptomyces sp. NPDC004111]|uniref:VOC family protein n=1 Tax=Streptomyces sp. NPDC004111 TaxID=3364690 RepID=UPI00367C6022
MSKRGFATTLWFDENRAEEAVDFYLSVFKDSSRGRTLHYNDAGPGPAGSVVTVEFELNGQRFIALNGGPEFKFSEAVSFQIDCADQAEVDHYWARLTEGGGQERPCGWLKDRFGVSWQVVPEQLIDLIADPDGARATRATKAMYAMKKIDLETVRKAHAGE